MTKLMGALLLAAAACGEVVDKQPGTFSVALEPTNAFLRRGESTDIQVTLGRDNLGDPIAVTVEDLPTGVTAGALEIGEDQTTGTLTLSATSAAPHGFASFTIKAAVVDDAAITSDTGFDLLVGGAPGDLDQSFATDGTFTPELGGLAMACRGVAITDQGIIVTGFVVSNPVQAITARVLDEGTLDPAYGSGGFVSTGSGTIAEGIALAALPDGSVVAAGIAGSDGASDNNFGLFRYDSAGALDANFGASGVEAFNPGTGFAEYHNVVVEAGGSLLVGGTVFGSTTATRAFRYSATGARDATFDVNEMNVVVEGSALQPDGKLLMVGSLSGDFWVARYTTTGARDTGFNGTGIVQTDFSNLQDTAHGVTVLADGKILVIGISAAAAAPISTISLARYNANGSLDVTFGTGGKLGLQTQFESRSPTAIAIRDGFLYFVGRRANDDQPAVGRFKLSDGSLDTTFGTTGIVAVDFGVAGTTSSTGGFGVAVDAVGRVVISGDVGGAGAQKMAIARLWF